jgi:hypothetical protein
MAGRLKCYDIYIFMYIFCLTVLVNITHVQK